MGSSSAGAITRTRRIRHCRGYSNAARWIGSFRPPISPTASFGGGSVDAVAGGYVGLAVLPDRAKSSIGIRRRMLSVDAPFTQARKSAHGSSGTDAEGAGDFAEGAGTDAEGLSAVAFAKADAGFFAEGAGMDAASAEAFGARNTVSGGGAAARAGFLSRAVRFLRRDSASFSRSCRSRSAASSA